MNRKPDSRKPGPSGAGAPQRKVAKSRKTTELRFNDKSRPFDRFTSFSPYAVRFNGEDYPTAGHLFEALKFENPKDAERIRQSKSLKDVTATVQKMNNRVRKDWETKKLNILAMRKTLLLKFTQHEDIKKLLLDTGEVKLIQDIDDPFWGVGPDDKGQNQFGIALMKVRTLLRK